MSLPFYDGKWLKCISLSVNQNIIPLSTATMQVLKEDVPPVRSYVLIETPNGVKEYYRTRQPQTQHDTDIATVQLDHAISEVGDYLIQGQINQEKTVAQAFSLIFSHYRGTKWQLGSFTATETVTVDCDYDNVLEALLSILEQAPQYVMTFNFNTTPWTMSLAQKSNTVTAEGRLSRNIESAMVKYDDKDLCTRVYVKGLPLQSGQAGDVGYMDSMNISTYGVVEAQTGSGNLTQEQAQRVAQAYLNANQYPKQSVEISGEDLFRITGESLDAFVCGKKFRLAIPEDNIVIEDYITKVDFSDVINSNAANIVIGNDLDPVINFLQNQSSSGKSYGRGIKDLGRENDIIHTEIYATGSLLYSFVEQTATYILTVVENVESDLGSAILQTANQIRTEVHASESNIYSYVDQTATYIRSEVASAISDVGSSILQTANQIRSEVHASESTIYSYVDQTATSINQVVASTASGLSSRISQQADKIALVVDGGGHIKAAEIAASINQQTGQSIVKLSADVIDIDGETIVDWLEGEDVVCAELETGSLVCGGTLELDVDAPLVGAGGTTADIGGLVVDVSVDPDTNVLTLTQLDGTVTTFSRAASGGNKVSGTWSGATLTVGQSITGVDTFTSVISTGFVTDTNVTPNTYHITAYRRDNNANQPTEIKSARTQYKLGVLSTSKTTVRILNSAGSTYINGTPTYTIPLTTKNATSNGTYSPSSSYVGFSSVTVNVPSDLPNARVRFSGSSGQYYVEAYDSTSSTSISGSSITYKLARSGTKVQIQNTSSSKISGTPEFTIPLTTKTVTANGSYTPSSSYVGFSSVTVNVQDPTPTVNTWSLTYKSAPYTYTASVKVNGTTYTSGNLSATNAYDNGWSAAYGKVVLPSAGTSSSVTVKTPASTSGGGTSGQITNTYKLSVAVGYAYLKNGSTTVGRIAHDYAYTSAQYTAYGDSQYEAGWKAGWDAFYDDSPDWVKDWDEGNNTKSVWTPGKNSFFDYWASPYGRGKGNSSGSTSKKWFEYTTSSSPSYNNTITIRQQAGYAGATKMVMYFKDNNGNYVAAANGVSMCWYMSSKSLGNTSSYKTMHY